MRADLGSDTTPALEGGTGRGGSRLGARDAERLLVGERVRLWPYVRQHYPADFLYGLWCLVRDAGAIDRLLWSHVPEVASPTPDFAVFERYIHRECVLYVAQELASGALMGFTWCDQIQTGYRACLNLFYLKPFWGRRSLEATRLTERFCQAAHGWRYLWGMTPWQGARSHGVRLGYTVQTLKDYTLIRGKPHDLYILRKELEHHGEE